MNKQKECKNNNIIESQGPKMDIDVELTNSNNLIGSLSTQASNSTNSINFSIESNNLNINIIFI
jgi:hypothetical protein